MQVLASALPRCLEEKTRRVTAETTNCNSKTCQAPLHDIRRRDLGLLGERLHFNNAFQARISNLHYVGRIMYLGRWMTDASGRKTCGRK